MKTLVLAVCAVGLVSWGEPATGLGFPGGKPVSMPLSPHFTADYDFEGIVGLSNCSGSLVRFDDSEEDDAALVLSNGHCVSMLSPGTVITDRSSSKRFTVLDAWGDSRGSVRASRILYATMTDTDMAVYQLRDTYREISRRFSIEPLTFSRRSPRVGEDIEVISGYWRRGYRCSVDAIVHRLREDDWIFKNAVRYSRPGCDVIGGTSGSPVVLAGTRTVVAVNNTGNMDGRRCTMNNPCEIDEEGRVSWEEGLAYAQQIYWLYSCRDGNGRLDTGLPGCLLPAPRGR